MGKPSTNIVQLEAFVEKFLAEGQTLVAGWTPPATGSASGVAIPTAEHVVSKTPPASVPSRILRQTGLLMTCFANQEDEGQETPAAPDDPPVKTAFGIAINYKDGCRVLGIALPWKQKPGKLYRIINEATGKMIEGVHHVDEGPFETHDPYLDENRRPDNESLKGQKVSWSKLAGKWVPDPNGKLTDSGAAVDAFPFVFASLLGKDVNAIYAESPSAIVTLEEYDAPTAPAAFPAPGPWIAATTLLHTGITLSDVVVRARSGIPLTVNYKLGAGGQSGTAPLPGTLLKDGTRESDCSGFGDWCEGVARDTDGWNTDYAFNDAQNAEKHYKIVPRGSHKPGQKLVVGVRPGHPIGHEGVISRVTPAGVADRVIHCSSMNPEGHAIAETDTSWFDAASAIAVEYLGLAPG